jgi:hypothetical protein
MRHVIHVTCAVVDGQCGYPNSSSSSVEDGGDIDGRPPRRLIEFLALPHVPVEPMYVTMWELQFRRTSF